MLTQAIPVSASDLHLLEPFVNHMRHLGSIGRHRVVFVPTREVSSEIAWAVDAMKTISPDVRSVPLDFTPSGDWPKACNRHFAATVQISAKFGTSWFFCELDTTFLVPSALDTLETELNLSGKLCLGPVVPTRFQEGMKGDHMVGCAIYPRDHAKIFSLHKFAPLQEKVPFDIYHRDEIRPYRHASKYMQHMWSTVNYRRQEGGSITCDPKEGNPAGSDHSGIVNPEAVLVHGCKDGSLAALVMSTPLSAPKQVLQEEMKKVVSIPKIFPQIAGDKNYKMGSPDTLPPVQLSAPKAVEEPANPIPERTPLHHFDALCESLGLFPSEQRDILKMLQDRAQPEPEVKETPSTPDGTQGDPASAHASDTPSEQRVASPSSGAHETKVMEDLPSKEAILKILSMQSAKLSDLRAFLSVPEDKKDAFKEHVEKLGFTLSGKAQWVKEQVRAA